MSAPEGWHLTPEEQGKTIIIEHIGGWEDGHVLRSDSTDEKRAMACWNTYFSCDRGSVGAQLGSVPIAAMTELVESIEDTPDGPRFKQPPGVKVCHIYEVVSRQVGETVISVRCKFVGRGDWLTGKTLRPRAIPSLPRGPLWLMSRPSPPEEGVSP